MSRRLHAPHWSRAGPPDACLAGAGDEGPGGVGSFGPLGPGTSRWRVGGNRVVVDLDAGAASADDAHVATTVEVANGQTTWVASVLASDQSCMRVAASSEHGMSSVSPVSGRDACTAIPGAAVADQPAAEEPAGRSRWH